MKEYMNDFGNKITILDGKESFYATMLDTKRMEKYLIKCSGNKVLCDKYVFYLGKVSDNPEWKFTEEKTGFSMGFLNGSTKKEAIEKFLKFDVVKVLSAKDLDKLGEMRADLAIRTKSA